MLKVFYFIWFLMVNEHKDEEHLFFWGSCRSLLAAVSLAA